MPHNDVKPFPRDLTDLQRQCLEGFWNRKPAKRIAVDLGISEAWVNKNLLAVRRQLNVGSSAEAAAIVFGSQRGSIKNYYYQETDLSEIHPTTDQALAGSNEALFAAVTSERALINNFGVGQTLAAVLAVAVAVIAGLVLMLQSAVGIHQLWVALGY
jgi:DNA-binding CsgD family transcriptional regulator